MKYLVVIELTNTGFSAYSPDVPGCVTTGATREETAKNMAEAISFHLEGLKLEGEPLPDPSSTSVYVEAAMAKPSQGITSYASALAAYRINVCHEVIANGYCSNSLRNTARY
jgi:predicted RNase H-like HicB family nuclease